MPYKLVFLFFSFFLVHVAADLWVVDCVDLLNVFLFIFHVHALHLVEFVHIDSKQKKTKSSDESNKLYNDDDITSSVLKCVIFGVQRVEITQVIIVIIYYFFK